MSNHKVLRVTMAKELKWSKQVEQIVHKANKVLALLKYTVDGKICFFFNFVQNFGSCNQYACQGGLPRTPIQSQP